MNLPNLLDNSTDTDTQINRQSNAEYFDPKKYEQLVSTAVLNKVIKSLFFLTHLTLPLTCFIFLVFFSIK